MIKTVHKWFWLWQFDEERRWLNEMAAKGLALRGVGFCRYDFEDCIPGEYKFCLELLKNSSPAETEKYIGFLEDTGAEHVGNMGRWAYFRRKGSGEFTLFSDLSSKEAYLTRVIRFAGFFGAINLYFFLYNLYLFFALGSAVNLVGILNAAVTLIVALCIFKLCKKRKALRKDSRIFE